MGRFYRLLLDDYSAASFTSFDKDYYGTLEEINAFFEEMKKDKEIAYRTIDKVSIVLNFLIAIVAFPFIFMVSVLSEIVADTSVWQQILYVTPALTVLGVAASVTLRRCGHRKHSLFIQFMGPILFAIEFLIVSL